MVFTQYKYLQLQMVNLHIILKNTQDCDKLLQKLRNCYKTQFLNLIDCKETQFLHSYIQLLGKYVKKIYI